MILYRRLLSVGYRGAGIALAGAIFAAGLLAGATLVPVTASRGAGPQRDAPASETFPARLADSAPARLAHAAEVLRVVDGDTFEARVQLWPGLAITTRVRLRGIDAPELRARCDDERAQAEAARDALRAILDQGEVRIAQVTLDKYGGRVIADAFTRATPDVAAALLETGVARRYGGGRRDGWCR
jgi:endonuclease YncB( thermonuclease family)